jgi:HEPN domain-containing protein
VNRKHLQKLATIRLREAKLLLSENAPDGAYYLAGYAVECALKACIAKFTKRHDFPDKDRVKDSYVHDLAKLINVADLKPEHIEAMRHLEFELRWKIVLKWSEASRYKDNSKEDARELIEAVENRRYGVLPWLKKHW